MANTFSLDFSKNKNKNTGGFGKTGVDTAKTTTARNANSNNTSRNTNNSRRSSNNSSRNSNSRTSVTPIRTTPVKINLPEPKTGRFLPSAPASVNNNSQNTVKINLPSPLQPFSAKQSKPAVNLPNFGGVNLPPPAVPFSARANNTKVTYRNGALPYTQKNSTGYRGNNLDIGASDMKKYGTTTLTGSQKTKVINIADTHTSAELYRLMKNAKGENKKIYTAAYNYKEHSRELVNQSKKNTEDSRIAESLGLTRDEYREREASNKRRYGVEKLTDKEITLIETIARDIAKSDENAKKISNQMNFITDKRRYRLYEAAFAVAENNKYRADETREYFLNKLTDEEELEAQRLSFAYRDNPGKLLKMSKDAEKEREYKQAKIYEKANILIGERQNDKALAEFFYVVGKTGWDEAVKSSDYFTNKEKDEIRAKYKNLSKENLYTDRSTTKEDMERIASVSQTATDYRLTFLTKTEYVVREQLVKNGDREKVAEFDKLMERELNKRIAEYESGEIKREVQSSTGNKIAANVGAVVSKPADTIAGAIGLADAFVREKTTGLKQEVDYNSPWFKGLRKYNTVVDATSEGMGSTGRFIYQTGMSMADNAVAIAVGAVTANPALATAIISAEAAVNSAYEATLRGASAEQAIGYGVAMGAIEVLTEKIGIDNVFKLAREGSESLLKAVVKQGIIEGAEESLSNILGQSADRLIMGDKSNYEQTVKQYIESGYTATEAKNKAFMDLYVKETVTSALGGALSGGVFGGGSYTINSVNTSHNGAEIRRQGNVSNLIASALKTEETETVTLAENLKNKIKNGSGVSNKEIGQLLSSYSTAVRNSGINNNATTIEGIEIVDGFNQPREIRDIVKKIYNRTGLTVSFGRMAKDGEVNVNFEGVYEPGRIIVSENATEEEIFRAIAAHEITHSIENTKYYSDIADFVIKQQFGDDNQKLELAIRKKMKLYAKNGVRLNSNGAKAELVASGVKEYIFADDVASIVEQDYTFGQRIHDYIGELIDNIKTKFGGTVSTSDLEHAQRKYRLALESVRNSKDSYGDIRYQIKENKLIGKVAFLDGVNIKKEKGKSYNRAIKDYFNEHYKDKALLVDTSKDLVELDQINKFLYPGIIIDNYNVKRSSVPILDEMIKIAFGKTWSENLLDKNGNVKKHSGLDCSGGFLYFETRFAIDNSGVIYGGTIIVRIDKNNNSYFYDLDNIRETDYMDENEFYPTENYGQFSLTEDTVPQDKPVVNSNSMQSGGNNSQGSFSFSDTATPTRNYTEAQKKAKNVIKEAIRNELNLKNNKLNNDLLDTFADNALDEIISDYALSDESIESIVKFMAERGTIVDNTFGEMYPELKQELRGTRIKVSDAVRNDIADYEAFRKSLQGALSLSKENGLPVDVVYRELCSEYPDLFPEDIVNPSDQLQTIAEVALKCKPKEVNIKDYYGNQFDSFKNVVKENIKNAVDKAYYGLEVEADTRTKMEKQYQKKFQNKEKVNEKLREENRQLRKDKQRIDKTVLEISGVGKFEAPEPLFDVPEAETSQFNDADIAEKFKNIGDFEEYDAEKTENEIRNAEDKYGNETEEFNPTVKIASPVYDHDFLKQSPEDTAAGMIATEKFLHGLKKQIKKVENRLQLTDNEKKWVNRIVEGEAEADIPQWFKDTNKYDELIELKRLYKDASDTSSIDRHKDFVVEHLKDTCDSLIAYANSWKTKIYGLLFERETFERNIRDVMPKEQADKIINWFYKPYLENETNKVRFSNELVDRIKALNLSKNESQLVQMVGEGLVSIDEVPESSRSKIENAVNVFHDVYKILKDNINEQLVLNGYKPIDNPKLKLNARETAIAMSVLSGEGMPAQGSKGVDMDKIKQFVNIAKKYKVDEFSSDAYGKLTATVNIPYFPHFDGNKDPVVKAMEKLGFNFEVSNLPGDLTGRTKDFKPGKRWFSNLLKRQGESTTYDALEGFDRYIATAGDVIFHTSDIKKLRGLVASLRSMFSQENVTEEMERQRMLAYKAYVEGDESSEYYNKIPKDLSKHNNLINWLENYANIIAGKQHVYDRNLESAFGRMALNISNTAMGNVAKNMASSYSSVISQLSQVQHIIGEFNPVHSIKALLQLVDIASNKEMRNESSFFTRKEGVDRLTERTVDKYTNASFTPIRITENFTSLWVYRTKYNECISKGMTHEEAINASEEYVASVMSDRTKGGLPTIFNSKHPMVRLFTMFQTEVNNTFSHITKDLPREAKGIGGIKGKAHLARVYAKTAFAAYVMNSVFKGIRGYGGLADLVELVKTILDVIFKDEEDEEEKLKEEIIDFIGGFVPFSSSAMSLLGIDSGRIPMSEGVPNFKKLASSDRDWVEDFFKPLAYSLVPGGLSQVKKTSGGIRAINEGGVYDNEGNLKYPAGNSLENIAKNLLFGKSSTDEARDYYDGINLPLDKKETEQYIKLPRAERQEFYNKTSEVKKEEKERTAIEDKVYNAYVDMMQGSDSAAFDKAFEKAVNKGFDEYNLTVDIKTRYNEEFGKKMEEEPSEEFWFETNTEKEKRNIAKKAGIDGYTYADVMQLKTNTPGTKDKNGDTIPGSSYINLKLAIDKEYGGVLTQSQLETLYQLNNIYEYAWDATEETKAKYYFSSKEKRELADKAYNVGVSYEEFYEAYKSASNIKGDKDANGDTIYLSASRKKKEEIDRLYPNMSYEQKKVIYEALGVSKKVWGYSLPAKKGGSGRSSSKYNLPPKLVNVETVPVQIGSTTVNMPVNVPTPTVNLPPKVSTPTVNLPPKVSTPTVNLPPKVSTPTVNLPPKVSMPEVNLP